MIDAEAFTGVKLVAVLDCFVDWHIHRRADVVTNDGTLDARAPTRPSVVLLCEARCSSKEDLAAVS
jgi:hypothetical protein